MKMAWGIVPAIRPPTSFGVELDHGLADGRRLIVRQDRTDHIGVDTRSDDVRRAFGVRDRVPDHDDVRLIGTNLRQVIAPESGQGAEGRREHTSDLISNLIHRFRQPDVPDDECGHVDSSLGYLWAPAAWRAGGRPPRADVLGGLGTENPG